MDLTFVPIDELFAEIDKRSDFFVVAYQLQNEPKKVIYTNYKDNAWFGNMALVSALQADLMWDSFKERNKKDGEET